MEWNSGMELWNGTVEWAGLDYNRTHAQVNYKLPRAGLAEGLSAVRV